MILILSQVPPPMHGSTRMTQLFLKMLNKNSIPFTLIDRRFSFKIEDVNKFKIHKIVKAVVIFLQLIKGIRFQARTEKKDSHFENLLILFFSTSRYSFIVDTIVFEISHKFKRRVILYLHTSTQEIFQSGGLRKRLFLRTLKLAEFVVVLGKSLESEILKEAPHVRTMIIPNTLNQEYSTAIIESPPYGVRNGRTFLYLSNLLPTKGLLDYIEFAKIYLEEEGPAVFKVIGPVVDIDFYESALTLVNRYKLQNYFEFLGFIDGARKYSQIVAADFLIFPSRYLEAQPLTILESLSVGTPVIAFDTGGVRDIITDGINGYVTKPDPKAILDAIRKADVNDFSMRTLRETSKKSFEMNFSMQLFESQWLMLLKPNSINY
jgi:glycosyltransferase involved in cell wall biosynthesis